MVYAKLVQLLNHANVFPKTFILKIYGFQHCYGCLLFAFIFLFFTLSEQPRCYHSIKYTSRREAAYAMVFCEKCYYYLSDFKKIFYRIYTARFQAAPALSKRSSLDFGKRAAPTLSKYFFFDSGKLSWSYQENNLFCMLTLYF